MMFKYIFIILIIILLLRILYLFLDDTHILSVVKKDEIYDTCLSEKEILLCKTDNFDEEQQFKYITNIEKKINKIVFNLRKIELSTNGKINEQILKKSLYKINKIYQYLSNIDSLIYKTVFYEELIDRYTYYYRYMNENLHFKINDIPIFQISKHHHAIEYMYKTIKENPGTILHVDSHADINEMKNNRKYFKKFISLDKPNKKENKMFQDMITDIGGVLVPMLLPYDNNNGIFWLTPDWVTEPFNNDSVRLAIHEDEAYYYGGTCPAYTIKRNKEEINIYDKEVSFTTSNVKYANMCLDKISNKYILNIDLDYFVTYGDPSYGFEGNDTRSDYRTELDVGYAVKDTISSYRKEEALQYECNLILKRIDNFLNLIKQLKLENKTPSMIIICDSTRINFCNYNQNNEKFDSEVHHEFMPKYLCFWVHNLVMKNLYKILED